MMVNKICHGTKPTGAYCTRIARKGMKTCYAHRGQEEDDPTPPQGAPSIASLDIQWQQEIIHTPETAPISTRVEFFLPADKPLPESYRKPEPTTCPRCRCIRLPDTGQAVTLSMVGAALAYFACKNCGFRFKLAVSR